MSTSVLIIDDDQRLSALLVEYLGRCGFSVRTAAHADAGLQALASDPPDLLVLDVMLPGMDGCSVCRRVRRTSRLPIVMLTARGDVTDRIKGLETGADDYLAKPFDPRELVARLQSVLRRSRSDERDILRAGPLEINWTTRVAMLNGTLLELTGTEFELLGLLARSAGRVLSREQIIEVVHGAGWDAYDRSIDVLVSRLRQKLGDEPRRSTFIRTVRGIGYSFVVGPSD